METKTVTETPAEQAKPSEKPLDQYTIVVTAPAETERDAVAEIERLDETQILDSLKGRATEKLFYEINQRGQQQIALSWAGVKYFTLQAGHISIEEVRLSETDNQYQAIAWARDKKRDVRVMGAAVQSKTFKPREGQSYPDEFALAKAVSKAQRNALRNLIPEPLISEAYRVWREQHAKKGS